MPEKTSTSQKRPDPTHIDWLVHNRAFNQSVSAKLYTLLRNYSDQVADRAFSPDAQMLIAVAFSLWRSVFLSDKTGYMDDAQQGAEVFLEELLLNNAIAYAQDRKSKDWTFNYYAANARYRLVEYGNRYPDLRFGNLILPRNLRTPKNRWNVLQVSFEKAVKHFEDRLSRAAAQASR